MVTKPFSKQEKQSVEIFHHIHICAQEVEGFHLLHPSIQHDIDFGN